MRIQHRHVMTILLLSASALGLAGIWARGTLFAQTPEESQGKLLAADKVSSAGVIESAQSVDLRCEVGGGSTILSLVADGSPVKKGDLVVELDDSMLRDNLAVAKIQAAKSKAALEQSKAELLSIKQQGESLVQFAEKSLQLAELSRSRVLAEGGELDCELAEVNSQLAIAQARLKNAENLISLPPEQRVGKPLQELQLMATEARETIKAVEARKQFLEKYERGLRSATLDLAVAEKKMQLARHRNDIEKARRMTEAAMYAQEAALARDLEQVARIEQQIAACKIHAPSDGTVIYAGTVAGRADRGAVIEEGAQVRERQKLVQIADPARLQVKGYISEKQSGRLQIGQEAEILCDAFPNRPLKGKLVHIGAMSFAAPARRACEVLVSIEDPLEGMRIGMTAELEISVGN